MKDSSLTRKRIKNTKESAKSDHLLQCDCPITLHDFGILASNSNKSNKRDKLVLRILTGKKHSKIKLQLLRKIRVWTFGSLVHQLTLFKRC